MSAAYAAYAAATFAANAALDAAVAAAIAAHDAAYDAANAAYDTLIAAEKAKQHPSTKERLCAEESSEP